MYIYIYIGVIICIYIYEQNSILVSLRPWFCKTDSRITILWLCKGKYHHVLVFFVGFPSGTHCGSLENPPFFRINDCPSDRNQRSCSGFPQIFHWNLDFWWFLDDFRISNTGWSIEIPVIWLKISKKTLGFCFPPKQTLGISPTVNPLFSFDRH